MQGCFTTPSYSLRNQESPISVISLSGKNRGHVKFHVSATYQLARGPFVLVRGKVRENLLVAYEGGVLKVFCKAMKVVDVLSLSTTMIYTHVLNKLGVSFHSPFD
jgi:hypothetical protein